MSMVWFDIFGSSISILYTNSEAESYKIVTFEGLDSFSC